MSDISNEAFPDSKAIPSHTSTQSTRKWWQIGGKDISYVSIDAGYDVEPSASESSSISEANKDAANVFVAPEAVELYKPVEGFEGAHRFDPSAQWSQEEENKLVRRVRWFSYLSAFREHTNTRSSSTGRLPYLLASCSSPCNLIAEISHKRFLITS